MISKIVEEQLKKCMLAKLDNYDEATNTYYISKYSKPTYEIGKCYLVKLPYTIINKQDSILAVNWNNCTAPIYEYYKVYVSKIYGGYIYCDCLAHDHQTGQDINSTWSGYLPINEILQEKIL